MGLEGVFWDVGRGKCGVDAVESVDGSAPPLTLLQIARARKMLGGFPMRPLDPNVRAAQVRRRALPGD